MPSEELSMDARLLEKVLSAFKKVGLEAVLVGNSAAAVHGAPVTTQDADCVIRETGLNIKKAKAAAKELGLSMCQPFLPASDVVRLEGGGIQVDLMFSMNRKSFEQVRSKATRMTVGSASVWVLSLEEIIAAKRRANRPKDRAVMPILEETLRVKKALAAMGEGVSASPRRVRKR